VTGPADMTANYLAVMDQRGMTWDDLADEFDRDAAAGRALDGGANARRMAAWARSQADAGRERARAADDPTRGEPIPDKVTPDPRKRTATPRDPAKRTAAAPAGATASSEVLDILDGGGTPDGD